MSNKICPRCRGKKQFYRRGFPVILNGWVKCETCDATGAISEQKAAMIEIGKDVKAKRTELRVHLREIAAANGFTVKDWSDIEHGDSSLENAYRARAIVEGLAFESKTVYDVISHGAFNQTQRITANTREEAEQLRDRWRESARLSNLTVMVEIKERIETTLNLEVGK